MRRKRIRRALISVSDKTGVVELAKALRKMKVEILSTGGTAKAIAKAGVKVVEVSDYTGVPEMFEGRVKTLVPEIQGGILFKRGSKQHRKEARKNRIRPIDLVVINLYQFRKAIKAGCTFAEAIEQIDIGGPTGIRAAAKNFTDVVVVVDPKDYPTIIRELQTHGDISQDTRLLLALKVFRLTARYDTVIANYLMKVIKQRAAKAA